MVPDGVWQRPVRCGSGACVEVRFVGGHVQVRDSKLGDESPVLEYTVEWWIMRCQAMQGAMIHGGGWLPGGVRRRTVPGGSVVEWARAGKTLTFTEEEWAAFEAAVAAGEYTAIGSDS